MGNTIFVWVAEWAIPTVRKSRNRVLKDNTEHPNSLTSRGGHCLGGRVADK